MKNCYQILAVLLLVCFSFNAAISQNKTITGTVKNSDSKELLPAVSILVKGSSLGTFTASDGTFKLTVPQFPVILVVSSIGFENKEFTASGPDVVEIELLPVSVLGQEVVVSASRVAERILESPVTIERVNSAAIRTSPVTNYYDIIGNLKGVDMVTAGLLFKTPSTRGFNSSGNLRLNQIVDGMDNQAPGLNFSLGNVIGITELDVDNMELLGGASSALYGPGGMNGTLLINSKSPFKYQGLSWQVKQGVMHVDGYERRAAPFFDWALRWAKQVSEKFAFKFGAEFIQAKDWVGNDFRNFSRGSNPITGKIVPGDRFSDPNYNGVNTYGDETTTPFFPVVRAVGEGFKAGGFPASIIDPIVNSVSARDSVSRTGYQERDVIDPTTINVKFSGSVNYKLTSRLEASLAGYFGTGNTVYTGSDRYSLKNLKMGQYKLELRSDRWFARVYTTQENAGESFNATVTTQLFNEAWKPSSAWYQQYATQYIQSRLRGANNLAAHDTARRTADIGRPTGFIGNSPLFKQVASTPIPRGGLFLDRTDLYMAEGQYNFTDLLNLNIDDSKTEVLMGGNFKQYVLNSQGTLFADSAGRIKIDEVGAYLQATQRLFNDRLKLTASGRYDKNENFKGRFTPRFSAVVGLATDHNLRLSYQTAYRFPSTQNQWINLTIGGGVKLIGGLPQLRDFYNFNTMPVYTQAGLGTGTPYKFDEYKPETASSYEVGYRGSIQGKLLVDVYGYYTEYKDFLSRIVVLQPTSATAFNAYSVAVNTNQKVNTRGWGASVEYLLPLNFSVNANVYSDEIRNVPPNFIAAFNTPKYRANVGLSNNGFLYQKRVGFSMVYRYSDEMYFEGDFGSGHVPSYMTLDGQLSYKFPEIRSMVKLGATNVFNKYYQNGFGNPKVGGLYYVSFGYNIF